jgi:hypothetical protein
VRTEKQHKNIVALSDIRRDKQLASSVYGPRRAGLTTSPRTSEDQALTELLNSLENLIADLNSKSLKVSDTLATATEAMRAEPINTTLEEDGTK